MKIFTALSLQLALVSLTLSGYSCVAVNDVLDRLLNNQNAPDAPARNGVYGTAINDGAKDRVLASASTPLVKAKKPDIYRNALSLPTVLKTPIPIKVNTYPVGENGCDATISSKCEPQTMLQVGGDMEINAQEWIWKPREDVDASKWWVASRHSPTDRNKSKHAKICETSKTESDIEEIRIAYAVKVKQNGLDECVDHVAEVAKLICKEYDTSLVELNEETPLLTPATKPHCSLTKKFLKRLRLRDNQ